MEMIHQLGIGPAAIIQFLIFVSVFGFLTHFVFTPYYSAFEWREEKTKGSEDLAHEFKQKSLDLHSEYQEKARETHAQMSAIYDKARTETMVECEAIIAKAREEANDLVESNRRRIADSIAKAASELKGQTSVVALAISNKLLGK